MTGPTGTPGKNGDWMVDDDVAEYHPTPNPHFVMSQATWDRVKSATPPPKQAADPVGVVGPFFGTPVYVGSCPALWGCKRVPTLDVHPATSGSSETTA